MIITIYAIVSELALPSSYNYWALLGLDIFATVFWIISFALLASEVATYSTHVADDTCFYYLGVCLKKRSLSASSLMVRATLGKRSTTTLKTYKNAMAAASGLGGLEL
jgi:hypothetical protein